MQVCDKASEHIDLVQSAIVLLRCPQLRIPAVLFPLPPGLRRKLLKLVVLVWFLSRHLCVFFLSSLSSLPSRPQSLCMRLVIPNALCKYRTLSKSDKNRGNSFRAGSHFCVKPRGSLTQHESTRANLILVYDKKYRREHATYNRESQSCTKHSR